jgi:hypothetical protein
MEDQQMEVYNEINAGWARIDALFRRNPFGEKALDSPAMKMAYTASFNMDTFRRFVFESSFLSRFHVPEERVEAVRKSDTALLLLGFDWILRFLYEQGPLFKRSVVP